MTKSIFCLTGLCLLLLAVYGFGEQHKDNILLWWLLLALDEEKTYMGRALVVGIDDYPSCPLRCCIKDAKRKYEGTFCKIPY